MPEGDTIHRTAARLRPALVGQPLVRADAPRLTRSLPPPGTLITAVEARGKHLLVTFAGGAVLQTHMRMSGSWHLYRPGERWRRPAHLARVVLEVPEWVAVCFSAPVVALHDAPPVDHLGPDLCEPGADLDECVRRFDLAEPGTAVADVLLDQRICCGVGNVYKSEVAAACGVHPLTPVERLDAPTRRALVETAARLLRANLTRSARTTVAGPPGSLAVYGRRDEPCRRCGTPIVMARTGPHARSTYWCPGCQPSV